MRVYDVDLREVQEALAEPDKVAPSIKGRYNAYKKVGARFVRITYADEEGRLIVVSVTPRERFWEMR